MFDNGVVPAPYYKRTMYCQDFQEELFKSTHKGVQETQSAAPLYEWISGVITGDPL